MRLALVRVLPAETIAAIDSVLSHRDRLEQDGEDENQENQSCHSGAQSVNLRDSAKKRAIV